MFAKFFDKGKAPELADEMKTLQSPIDGKIIVVAFNNGREVCQYCFKPFYGDDTEAYPLDKLGNPIGEVRSKVHGKCHDEYKKSGRWAQDGIEPRG